VKAQHKRYTLLLITICVDLSVFAASPTLYQPPRLADQLSRVLLNLALACVPLAWSILLIFWKRDRFILWLGLINLIPSASWLLTALVLLAKAYYR
jgi:uncharacterized membrane protein